jgi:dienelactone hydrolase
MMKSLVTMIVLLSSVFAFAKVKSEKVVYAAGESKLEGFLYYDAALFAKNKKLPGVVIVHDWMGVGDYVKMRAEQMASLGYMALVADIYGQGVRPQDVKQAGELAGKYKAGDRAELRARAKAAFELLAANKRVEASKIAAMGYCFGGTVALEMARIGLPLTGAISFHGGLNAVKADDAKNIKTKLLVLHGAIDPYVAASEVSQFQKELNEANVNYEFVAYSGAVHAFTEKHAGTDIKAGAAYNEQADKRSFVAMQNFLTEVNK